MSICWTAYDHEQVRRFLEQPRIHFSWRGLCDGLPEFIGTWSVKQGSRILFSSHNQYAAECFLDRLLSPVAFDRSIELIEMGCA